MIKLLLNHGELDNLSLLFVRVIQHAYNVLDHWQLNVQLVLKIQLYTGLVIIHATNLAYIDSDREFLILVFPVI